MGKQIDDETGEQDTSWGYLVNSLSSGSKLISWNENSVFVDITTSQSLGTTGKYSQTIFKAGETYTYFVWGGVKNDEILPN